MASTPNKGLISGQAGRHCFMVIAVSQTLKMALSLEETQLALLTVRKALEESRIPAYTLPERIVVCKLQAEEAYLELTTNPSRHSPSRLVAKKRLLDDVGKRPHQASIFFFMAINIRHYYGPIIGLF